MTSRRPSADDEAALAPLVDLARSGQPPGSPSAVNDPSYHQVRQALRGRRPRRWLIPASIACGLGAAAALYLTRTPALDFTVEGAGVAEGGYLQAPAAAGAAVRFSDGTEVQLERQSRGRVAWTDARGARVMLEHGRARVKVVPRKGSRWQFDAGPCVVQVTGTRFEMRWSDADQVLEVSLTNGSVIVRGPPAPNGMTMHAGQRLVMDVRQGFARLEALENAAPAVASESAAASEPSGPRELPPASGPAPARAERRSDSWSERVLAGDFGTVLREARHGRIDDVLRRAGPADLMALAEAARYSGETALARRTLGAVRARFPGSGQSNKAAFLLGRMAEDGDGDLTGALEWYGRYLADAPEGAFRDEALGRKMTATLQLAGQARARPLAEEYLRRFPNGSYAAPARVILAAPK
jgi:hypothetical protein